MSDWIPLTKALPADNVEVLFVVVDRGKPDVVCGTRSSGFQVGGTWHPMNPTWHVAYDMYEGDHWPERMVTHWMPLPAPPPEAKCTTE